MPTLPDAVARTEVERTVVTPEEVLTVDELVTRAEAALLRGDPAAALADFDRVSRAAPEDVVARGAILRAAEAAEAQADHLGAADRLEQLARRCPRTPEAREALVRLVRLRAFLDQWDRAGRAGESLLADYPDLGPVEQLVAHSGKALMLLQSNAIDAASYEVEKGRAIIDELGLDRAGRISPDAARLFFALGEVRRARAESIRFVPVPTDFAAVLERRCELLLDAQSAYSATMRAYDAHWSTMAGLRTGELYQSLHRALMEVPPPASADTQARRELFEGAMRLRYSILLEKALAMIDHTLAMTARTNEESAWVLRAEGARRELELATKRETETLDRLPYSRDELRAALESLARSAKP
ncbi:MAG: hypothetical protein JW751_28035 [Polyangiaceae bacterium]|nr:hypothetical protein [Polyangiaceae bacterium]